jgi:hypothetical protein
MSTAQNLASLGQLFSTQSLMFRNKIINGNFDIWQRGGSLSNAVNNAYLADRWYNGASGTSTSISAQAFVVGQTDVPNGPRYFHRVGVSSVAGAGNYSYLSQAIEGVAQFSGQTVTLTFWAKADAAKNIAIEFIQNFGAGGSAAVLGLGSQLIPLTTVWKKFKVQVALPSISGKTLGTANTDSLQFIFWMDAGSSVAARTASLGQQSGTFDFSQVQIEVGTVDSLFEVRPPGLELLLCQRYFCSGTDLVNTSTYAANSALTSPVTFPVIMRIVPTVVVTPSAFSGVGYTSNLGNHPSTRQLMMEFNSPNGANNTGVGTLTWSASAEF